MVPDQDFIDNEQSGNERGDFVDNQQVTESFQKA
jgi:hypothetical protein